MLEEFSLRYSYLMTVLLLVIGLYAVLYKRNLMKKLIGLTIFQTAIFLFFIEGSMKSDATVPVIDPALGPDPNLYMNPLPHVLMLTAIVVGVAMIGVALALLLVIYRRYGSLEEGEILERMRRQT